MSIDSHILDPLSPSPLTLGMGPDVSYSMDMMLSARLAAGVSGGGGSGHAGNRATVQEPPLCVRSVVRRIAAELHDLSWMSTNMLAGLGRRSSLPLHALVLCRFVRHLENLSSTGTFPVPESTTNTPQQPLNLQRQQSSSSRQEMHQSQRKQQQ